MYFPRFLQQKCLHFVVKKTKPPKQIALGGQFETGSYFFLGKIFGKDVLCNQFSSCDFGGTGNTCWACLTWDIKSDKLFHLSGKPAVPGYRYQLRQAIEIC